MTDTNVVFVGEWQDGDQPEPAEGVEGITLRVTAERTGEIPLAQWLASRRGDAEATVNLAIHYMVNERGEYINEQEAAVIVGRLKLRDFNRLVGRLMEAIGESAAPKKKG